MPLAICLRTVVLPALGGETIKPRWPRPIGRDQIDQAGGQDRRLRLEQQLLVGEDGRQFFELRALFGFLGIEPVDGLDLEQAVVLLRLFGRAHLADDQVAGAQPKAADLALRDVDIVRAGHHVLVCAQKADAVLDDFQRAAAEDQSLLLRYSSRSRRMMRSYFFRRV